MQKIIDLLQSRTNIVGILTTLVGVATFFGIDVPISDPDVQQKIVAFVTAFAGILTVFFRTAATKKIGGGSLE